MSGVLVDDFFVGFRGFVLGEDGFRLCERWLCI